jgi:transcriptional regulator with XRE-family HTH domain
MPVRQGPNEIGAARGRFLRQRLSAELRGARLNAGLSLREVAHRLGVSVGRLSRIERAQDGAMTVDLLARFAAVVGLELSANVHPNGDPVRDRAHLGLLARLRRRLHPSLHWRTEVPIPISGDARSADATIGDEGWSAMVEAETRVGDFQLTERKASAKARDLGTLRLILLIADTRHNRSVLRLHPELEERFPVSGRACLRALANGHDPGGDALVVL